MIEGFNQQLNEHKLLQFQQLLTEADILFSQKLHQQALAKYISALEITKQQPQIYYKIAQCFTIMKDYENAIKFAMKQMTLNLQDKHSFECYKLLKQIDEIQPQNNNNVQYQSKCFNIDPNDAPSHNSRAVIHQITGNKVKALKDFDRAIEIDNTQYLYYSQRANIHHRMRNYENALLDYSKAIQLNNSIPQLYFYRGIMYKNIYNIYDQAIQDFSKAIQLDTTNISYYYQRAHAFYKMKLFSDCINDCSIIISQKNDEAKYYALRGKSFFQLKQYKRAISNFAVALMISQKGGYYMLKGRAHYYNHNFEKALKDLNQALKLQNSRMYYYSLRGLIHYCLGNYQMALIDYHQAIKIKQEKKVIDDNDILLSLKQKIQSKIKSNQIKQAQHNPN